MTVFVTLRIESFYEEDYLGETPYTWKKTKVGNVFYTLEKAYAYVEEHIALDKQKAFKKYENPIISGRSDIDGGASVIELNDESETDCHCLHEHSVQWIILKRDIA